MSPIVKTAGIMSFLTLISKLIGFSREMVLAGFYGTNEIVDIYVLASSIPTYILGPLFLAVSTAYMPLLAEKDKQGLSKRYTDQVITIVLFFATLSVLMGIVCSDFFVKVFGYDGELAQVASIFCKIAFCYVVFSAVNNVQASYLQYKNIFVPQILAGYCISVAIIICIIASTKFSIYLLPMGYIFGYGAVCVIQTIVLRKNGYRYKFDHKIAETIKSIAVLAPVVFVGSAVNQINGFIDKLFATSLGGGSVAALNYGNLVQTTIIALTITVITTIIYPKLTKAAVNEEYDSFGTMVKKGFHIILIITIPCMLGIICYSTEIVQIIFERGAFDSTSTNMTAIAFLFYGVGLVFVALNQFITQVYYSMKDMKTPVICGVIGVFVNVGLNFALVGRMGHGGLALASSVAAMVNACAMIIMFRKKYSKIGLIESASKIGKNVLAAVCAVGGSYLIYMALTGLSVLPMVINLGISILAACIIYLALLWAMKFDEIEMLKAMLKR